MSTPISAEDRFVRSVLHTDTVVYEIVARTARTLKLRRTKDIPGARWADLAADEGAHGLRPAFYGQQPDPDAPTVTVRLRKDGTYRVDSWSALRPAPERDGVPARYTDWRT